MTIVNVFGTKAEICNARDIVGEGAEKGPCVYGETSPVRMASTVDEATTIDRLSQAGFTVTHENFKRGTRYIKELKAVRP